MHLKRSLFRRWSRQPLPSLFDRRPDALAAPRHARGVREVPLDAIVGTARHPSQNTADFLPMPALRGRNWEARWQRIRQAMKELAVLPPVDLLQVGNEYWVVDGHNRIAAARQIGAEAVDADVIELLLGGATAESHAGSMATSLVGSEALRQAAEGRLTRGIGYRTDEVSRQELAINAEQAAEAEAAEQAAHVAEADAADEAVHAAEEAVHAAEEAAEPGASA